jgi:hypothetical protein
LTILALDDIVRKETFIYYRREFTARAKLDLPGKPHSGSIEFSIETEPTGKKDIIVKFVDSVDYPLLPVVTRLKQYILDLDKEGRLP